MACCGVIKMRASGASCFRVQQQSAAASGGLLFSGAVYSARAQPLGGKRPHLCSDKKTSGFDDEAARELALM